MHLIAINIVLLQKKAPNKKVGNTGYSPTGKVVTTNVQQPLVTSHAEPNAIVSLAWVGGRDWLSLLY